MGTKTTAVAETPEKITYPEIFNEISESINRFENFFPLYDKLVTQIRYRDEKNELQNIILNKKDVSLEVEAAGGLTNDDKKHHINRLEVRGSAMLYGDSHPFIGFSLNLNFVGQKRNFSFMVAVTKGNGCDGHYGVWLHEDELMIRDGGSAFVKFSSKEDFDLVMKFCNYSIAKFNYGLLKKDHLKIYYK